MEPKTALPETTILDNPQLKLDEDGHLQLAGHRAGELAAQFGTPLVVLLEDLIRANCRDYLKRLERYPRARVYFAGKALLTLGICKLLAQEGMGLDVVSSGELHTALQAGFPPERILMHGNAKSVAELKLALDAGVGRLVIDNLAEIERLAELTRDRTVPAKVFIRVTPGVKPDTHRYVQTGQEDSKFGFNLAGGAAEAAARRILEVPGLELVGLHCHIGSQIMEAGPFHAAAQVMLEFYAMLVGLGAPLDELNLGGGLGVRYAEGHNPPDIAGHAADLSATVLRECEYLGIKPPVLCDEPGRSIIAEAGVTLYTVESVKQIEGVRNYVSVNGGMTDNPRHALYEATHHTLLAERVTAEPEGKWSVSGKCCESGDMLATDVPLPVPRPGELLAQFTTGAYTYSMASNYNRVPRPAVVLVGERGAGLLQRRESPEDITRLDEVPEWLK